MNEQEQLQQTIAGLTAQRALLGEAVYQAALEPLRRRLAELESAAARPPVSAAAERRLVTVMFADVSGFTALAETMDPEAVRDLMNACFECLVPVILEYGGTVDKFIGDSIMALFGAPVAYENDSERALCAALKMSEALAAFNRARGADLGLHFGINTGLALAGGIGTQAQQAYSVIGDTVNVAARLEDASERGQALVGPDTYRLTEPLFEFEAVPPLQVKGRSEPVQAYLLLRAKARPGRVRGLESQGISSPLVGRDEELAAFRRCLERLHAGQGGIVCLLGEAGLGKSRLMAEVQSLARSNGAPRWIEGRSLSFGQEISYWPFQEIVRQWAGITEEDGEEGAWQKLHRAVTGLFPGQEVEVLPYLASLLGLSVQGEFAERVKYLDGEALGGQIFFTSRRFFEQLARQQPLALVFEDLHWADRSSVTLLEHLLPLVETVPLLIAAASRPDPDSPVTRLQQLARQEHEGRYTEIRLEPLSRDESAQLVHNLLVVDALPGVARDMILRKAEGNPFFVEEVIRALIAGGAIVRDATNGRWQATAQVEKISIPDTLQGVIMARVDRLDEGVKQILRAAAVIGRAFLYRVLRAIAEADRALDEHLLELQQVELIREKSRLPELEYIFKHALAQEATYESILLQKRRELHAQVSRAIESLFADRLDEFSSLLAYHYAKGEVWEKAQEYLFKAGDKAGRVAADAEALGHYQQAMAAYGRAFGDHWDPLQRAVLECKIGEAFFRRGENDQARVHLRQSLALLGFHLPVSRREVRSALIRQFLRQVGHRLLPALYLRRPGPLTDGVLEVVATAWDHLIWIDVNDDSERVAMDILWVLNLAEEHGSLFWQSIAMASLALVNEAIEQRRLADFYGGRAIALGQEIQQPKALGFAYLSLGMANINRGRLTTADEHLQRSEDMYRPSGDLHRWGGAATAKGIARYYLGDYAGAAALFQEVVSVSEDIADHETLGWGLHHLAMSKWNTGQMSEAEVVDRLHQAIALLEPALDSRLLVMATGDLGQFYLHLGKLQEALPILEKSGQIIAEHGLRPDFPLSPARNGLAEAYLVAAERSNGPERAAWLNKARRACGAALLQGRASRPGLPEALRLRGRYEWLRGHRRAALRWWQKSLAAAEQLQMPYEAAMAHLEIGERRGERPHLEQAEAILGQIGAVRELTGVREQGARLIE